MGPPSYMQSVVDRNVVMQRMPVIHIRFVPQRNVPLTTNPLMLYREVLIY